MIPAKFDYVRAGSAEEAISLIGEHGEDAKFLAGGHSLLPLMKLRLAQPSVLVDIGRIARPVVHPRRRRPHRHRRADAAHGRRDVRRARRARAAARARGEPRRRPAGAPPRHDRRLDRPRRPGVATSRRRRSRSARPTSRRVRTARREIAAADFYQGFLDDALAPDEMLVEIQVPKMSDATWGFQKFNRRAQDWAIVGVAAWRRNGESRRRPRQHGVDADPRHEREQRPVRRRVGRRRGGARRRRRRTAGRPQRQRRVPGPPRQGAHETGPRGPEHLTLSQVGLRFETRASDSPWIDTVWSCTSEQVTEMTSVAAVCWGLVFWQREGTAYASRLRARDDDRHGARP